MLVNKDEMNKRWVGYFEELWNVTANREAIISVVENGWNGG